MKYFIELLMFFFKKIFLFDILFIQNKIDLLTIYTNNKFEIYKKKINFFLFQLFY